MTGSVLGIDLGGTKIRGTRYSSSWKIEDEKQIETHAKDGFEKVYERMLELIESLDGKNASSIGVGVPGLIESDGTIFTLPNIPGAEKFPLQKRLTEDLQLPIKVSNDANSFALAEALQGAGKGHSVLVGITIGTGVGGGIIINGKPFRGAHGFGAEIGHALLHPGTVPYKSKDTRGDIEQYISGTALGKRSNSSPEDYLNNVPEVFTEIAQMCASITHVIDPSIIVFGGSVGRALTPHLKTIEKEMGNWILPGTPLPKLAIAKLENSSTLGAALFTQYGSDF